MTEALAKTGGVVSRGAVIMAGTFSADWLSADRMPAIYQLGFRIAVPVPETTGMTFEGESWS